MNPSSCLTLHKVPKQFTESLPVPPRWTKCQITHTPEVVSSARMKPRSLILLNLVRCRIGTASLWRRLDLNDDTHMIMCWITLILIHDMSNSIFSTWPYYPMSKTHNPLHTTLISGWSWLDRLRHAYIISYLGFFQEIKKLTSSVQTGLVLSSLFYLGG